MPFGIRFGTAAAATPARRAGGIDLQNISPLDLAACCEGLEASAAGASTREDAAGRMVQYLFDSFRTAADNERACALVRCFQTCPMSKLPSERRAFALRQLGSVPYRENMTCLALLATRGIEPQWNYVGDSAGHLAIPLPSVEVIIRAPMIARLLLQMGIRYEHVVSPPEGDDFLVGPANETLKVFHVARARNSRYIPAQSSFVHRYAIRSVLGLGGLSPAGELFAVVMFTRVQVSRETAAQFRTLAAVVREMLMRFPAEQAFSHAG